MTIIKLIKYLMSSKKEASKIITLEEVRVVIYTFKELIKIITKLN